MWTNAVSSASGNIVHPGEMDASSEDCPDVEQTVPTDCVDRHQVSVTVMMTWHLRHVKVGVFFTHIGVDCCVAVAFEDRWHPDIVVKVLYAQWALVNVMHPVQDIHSWKVSLVPDVWWLYWCVDEQCDKLLQGQLRLSYMSNPSTNRTAEITQSHDHFRPRLARWIFKAATRGNRGLYRIDSSKWRQSMVRAMAARKWER